MKDISFILIGILTCGVVWPVVHRTINRIIG
nr:MAG TPA: hypothetical protein [Caudoviricetes sp.]